MSVLYYFVLLLLACTVSCPNVTVNDCVVLTMGFHYVFLRLGRGRLVFFFFFILACSVMNAVDRHQHHDASSSSSSLDDRHTHPTRTTKRREEGEEQHSTTINNKHNQDTTSEATDLECVGICAAFSSEKQGFFLRNSELLTREYSYTCDSRLY